MEVEVGRLAVRCRGRAGDGGRALAVRRRMEQVARGPLPGALARALGDADVTIDRLEVPLDFELLDHDAETIAVLWADRIRVSLAAAVSRAPTAPGASSGSRARPAADAREDPAAPGRAEAWPDVEAGRRLVRRIERAAPTALVALARALEASGPETLTRLWASLTVGDRTQVLRRLEAAAALVARGGPESRRPGAAPGHGSRGGRAPAPASVGPPRAAAPTPTAWHDTWRAVAAVVPAAPAGIPDRPPRDLLDAARDAARTTGAVPSAAAAVALHSESGGLVLLYPWLDAFLARARTTLTATAPTLHPTDARRLALLRLVHGCADTCDMHRCVVAQRVQHDPLVRLLAGYATDAATADLTPHDDALHDDTVRRLAGEADALLRTFAGVLPGFERSTPGYLRANLIARPATVEQLADGVHVRLPPAPLDALVARLPYPLGTFALGWTDPIHVHLEVA